MKFGVVNKSTTVNIFVLHTLQRNITHLAVITHKTNIKLGILKRGGGNWKRAQIGSYEPFQICFKKVTGEMIFGSFSCTPPPHLTQT